MIYTNHKPIAILLAVYNGGKYLGEQIDSLLNQTNQEWTLYIRNDGSTDSTQLIIDDYINKNVDKIVQIDKGDANIGWKLSFFTLFEQVQSDYYCFCDADDFWIPEKVELSINKIREYEKQYINMPILVFGDNSVCDENLNLIAPSWWRAQRMNPALFITYNTLPICNVVGGATMMFNNKIKPMCFPIPMPPLSHDTWIPMQVAKYGKIFIIDKSLKLYRQHSSNESGASCEPYKFKSNKIVAIRSIIKRDVKIAKYFQSIGYGSVAKYFYNRVVVLIKLQWSKITYR